MKSKMTVERAFRIFLDVACFLPLFLFKVWASSGPSAQSLSNAAGFMLACSIFILIVAYRHGRPSYFDWAVTVYFAVIVVSLYLWPEAAAPVIEKYPVTGIYAVLFGAAFVPPLIGMEPFTYRYAKRVAPEEVWGHPIFIRINLIITWGWSALFLVCILLSLYPSFTTRFIIPMGLILGVGRPLTTRFPDFYLKRYVPGASAGAGSQTQKKETSSPE